EITLPMTMEEFSIGENFIAEREKDKQNIPCQIIEKQVFKSQDIAHVRLIFPVSSAADEKSIYVIRQAEKELPVKSQLSKSGNGFDLIIENSFYKANLTKSTQSEAKSHESGQLRELLIKSGMDVLLLRTENRMHWAPNFQNMQVEYYKTIAGWDNPANYEVSDGPYLVRTIREDRAPEHEEILLSANYSFYDGLPYFRFYSSMTIEQDIVLKLLRNDEMTMDSLFTHVAYQKNPGTIVDLAFNERHQFLESEPISNEAGWLCFYNEQKGYAFGSIRIKYDISNNQGLPSPTYLPHTKISDGAGGGKYWNRRLIHDHPVYVPAGSRYVEENAYIVFKINPNKKFNEIEKWANLIQHPLEIHVYPGN
ncbi:MAG: hypothetical protein KDF60_18920, partial [Calditrichaeota bacterium]|nr:hypothetical protein [Calditrichota bacterium]